jgi:hypothetical protein
LLESFPVSLGAGHNPIMAVLDQASVDAAFSGVAAPTQDGRTLVEGVEGLGDAYMLGRRSPQRLPSDVEADVKLLHRDVQDRFGPVRMEWVYDGRECWIIQVQSVPQLRTPPAPSINGCISFDASTNTLVDLQRIIKKARKEQKGVRVVGDVGVLSHVGDMLDREGIPTTFEHLA